MTYTCRQCAHQSTEDVLPMRKGNIQPGVERWCVPCKTTRFHYAALTEGKSQEALGKSQDKPRTKNLFS